VPRCSVWARLDIRSSTSRSLRCTRGGSVSVVASLPSTWVKNSWFPGLSSCLCKLICGWLVEVGAEAVGVGQGEGAEGLAPAGCDGAFDESARGFALVAG
jgi:hypothetical protein